MKVKYKSWIPINSNGRATVVGDEVAARKAAIADKAAAAQSGRSDRLKAARNPAKTVEELAKVVEDDTTEVVEDDTTKVVEDETTKVVEEETVKNKEEPKDEDKDDEDDESWMDDYSDDDDKKSTDDVDEPSDSTTSEDDDDKSTGNKEMRLRIEEQSSLRKTAESKLAEAEIKLDEAEAKLKVEEEKSKNLASQSIDWSQHESITPLQTKFDQAVYRGASLIDNATAQSEFAKDIQGPMLQEYYDATKDAKTVGDKLKADAAFRTVLEKKYNVDIPSGVVAHVKDAVDTYIDMDDTVASLRERHSNNQLSTGIVEYEAMMKDNNSRINDLGNVDDTFMEASPDSIETLVGAKYRDDADFKKKADKLKRRASEFFYGLKPLTQDQMDKVSQRASSEGLTVQKFMERRAANYEEEKAKFFNDVFYKSMAMEDTDEMRKVYQRYLKSKNKSKSVREAASKTKTKDTKTVTKVVDTTKTTNKGTKRNSGLPADYIPVSKRTRV
tara:strand:- start:291 stop:1790 length:1500 start_codon:yes stop_codon:yes gene_type:complete